MKCFCECTKITNIIQKEEVLICPKCGLISKVKIVSNKLEKQRYDMHICDVGYKKYMNNIYLSIKDYLMGDCLDYGCGKIHLLSDIINENKIKCDYYDLYYYPILNNKKYDTIILVEVFEHLKEPYEELLKIKRMLNENGRIIIITKPYEEPLDNWWYFRDITHINFINKDTLNYWNLNMNIINIRKDIFILNCI